MKRLNQNKLFIELLLAMCLFILTIYYSKEKVEISFSSIIGLLLYFMIFLEVVRATGQFIFDKSNKFMPEAIYNMGIIFLIRELLVTLTAKHDYIEKELSFLIAVVLVLLILFSLRLLESKNRCAIECKKIESKKVKFI